MEIQGLKRAVELIRNADAIFIGTGAGMGVGSGLGTFRGKNAGVWAPLERRNMVFPDMSSPRWFTQDPHFAWAFWHWRYTAYTSVTPHEGYTILKKICDQKKYAGFSFTSNIDGHWVASGFSEDRILECHGSLRYMQCHRQCKHDIWAANNEEITQLVPVSDEKMNDPLPKCIHCGNVARPNVLMFGDWEWFDDRCVVQNANESEWLELIAKNNVNIAVIEIGAGVAVPTVRLTCERIARQRDVPLIRINLEETTSNSDRIIFIPMGGLEALLEINKLL